MLIKLDNFFSPSNKKKEEEKIAKRLQILHYFLLK